MMKHLKMCIRDSTVIVECGFLSNPDEELKLQKEDYQGKIVDAICEGLLAYLR